MIHFRNEARFSVELVFIGLLLCCGREAAGQANPPQNRFSTHDWTRPTFGGGEPMIGINDFREFWADVKTPGTVFAIGTGFAPAAYSVGTIEVRTTSGAFFSDDPAGNPGATASPAGLLPTFTITGPTTPARQVVMLQQAALGDTRLGFQKFYYGENPLGELRATHGRGIAVWPGLTADDTRIAICGESQDAILPRSNVPSPGWPGAGGAGTAGFIAMFDGNGVLLWSHHFFGLAPDQHCAITDVSITVDNTSNPLKDIVTFCGISTYGMPSPNATLTAVLPFTAPTSPCTGSAGGATNNGAGQWDGIVGRLSRAHDGSGATSTLFLSSVGGSQQDGLFGIADIDGERFAVGGSTGNTGVVPPGLGFPVTVGN